VQFEEVVVIVVEVEGQPPRGFGAVPLETRPEHPSAAAGVGFRRPHHKCEVGDPLDGQSVGCVLAGRGRAPSIAALLHRLRMGPLRSSSHPEDRTACRPGSPRRGSPV
jgi:hypothetical protein